MLYILYANNSRYVLSNVNTFLLDPFHTYKSNRSSVLVHSVPARGESREVGKAGKCSGRRGLVSESEA